MITTFNSKSEAEDHISYISFILYLTISGRIAYSSMNAQITVYKLTLMVIHTNIIFSAKSMNLKTL